MAAEPQRLLMSVEDYLALDRSSLDARYEFIDGHVYMLVGGNADHSTITINMMSLLHNHLRGGPCRVYNADMRVRLTESRYVFPDVSVSCDARDRGKVDILQYPRLIVEVLSPSTSSYDRSRKFSYYRACPTIQEYVLVETQWQAVEIFRRAFENLWTYHFFGAGDLVELASLGVSFPITALYENVTLSEDLPDE